MTEPTFITALLAGEAAYGDIDDWVERWHNEVKDSTDTPLHEFLGMTWDEYARWVKHPLSLAEIIESHRPGFFGLAALSMEPPLGGGRPERLPWTAADERWALTAVFAEISELWPMIDPAEAIWGASKVLLRLREAWLSDTRMIDKGAKAGETDPPASKET